MSPHCYLQSREKGWLNDIVSHMENVPRTLQPWTASFERCRQEALKYKYRVDFLKGSPGAYQACRRKRWLNDVCTHMSPHPLSPKARHMARLYHERQVEEGKVHGRKTTQRWRLTRVDDKK